MTLTIRKEEDVITEPTVWEGVIAEMGPLDTSTHPELQIPADYIAKIKASDDDPLFVTVEVEAGWSRSRRKWSPDHLRTVVNKVNKDRMAGNLGHPLLDPKSYERDFPIPQVAWAAATMNGNKAVFKGYVLKTAQARELLKLGLIDGVSIFGDSKMRPIQGGYEVISFDPETIDFARKGRSGMTSRIVALTGEQMMEGGSTVEAKDVAALQVDDIKTHAPLLFKAIQDDATGELNTKIGEQAGVIEAAKPELDVLGEIKKLLKVTDGENPVEKLATFLSNAEEAARSEIKAFVNELIAKKFKTDRSKALVARLIGEMHSEYDGPLTDDLRSKIEDDFKSKIADDEDIKGLVGEMVADNDGHEGGSSLGGRSRAGSSPWAWKC